MAASSSRYQAQLTLLDGERRAPAAAAPVVVSSEAAPTVLVLAPSGAPAAAVATPTPTGLASMKALELRSDLEGGAANGAYSTRLRGGLYTYASPPPEAEALILPPPPMVYVKETITTVTTTYPAGALPCACAARRPLAR